MEVIIASVYCFHSEFSFPYIYQNLVTMNKYNLLLFAAISLVGCKENEPKTSQSISQMETEIRTFPTPVFTLEEANNLIYLPLHCVRSEERRVGKECMSKWYRYLSKEHTY